MPEQMPSMPGGEIVSKGFMAALLKAGKGDCSCEPCKILRKIGDEMTKGF